MFNNWVFKIMLALVQLCGVAGLKGQESRPKSRVTTQPIHIRQETVFPNIRRASPGHIFSVLHRQSGAQTFEINFSEPVSVIVEFREHPLSIRAGRETATVLSLYETREHEFQQDLNEIVMSLASAGFEMGDARIRRSFSKVFYGVSVSVPRAALAEIYRLSYVKTIHLNTRVKATLLSSVPLIRADSVWAKFGTRGEGVVVGIIDTGIDGCAACCRS